MNEAKKAELRRLTGALCDASETLDELSRIEANPTVADEIRELRDKFLSSAEDIETLFAI